VDTLDIRLRQQEKGYYPKIKVFGFPTTEEEKLEAARERREEAEIRIAEKAEVNISDLQALVDGVINENA